MRKIKWHSTPFVALGLAFAAALCAPAQADQNDATHKQVRSIKPTHDGEDIKLHTFCLDADGNILACCGGKSEELVTKDDGSFEFVTHEQECMIQVISPQGERLRSYPVDFTPTAISVGKDGSIFVAGEGHIVKLDSDGNQLHAATTPNAGDLDELRKRVEADIKVQMERIRDIYREQVETAEKQIAKISEIPEADRSKRQKRQLSTAIEQKKVSEEMLEDDSSMASVYDPERMIQNKLRITSISATEQDVFLSCAAEKGFGYDIWRVDHNFENGKRVLSEIGGCCGQMDIKAEGEMLLVAENTKYRVGIYDREGQEMTGFGKADRKSQEDGFGSCCNPMNLCCTPDGDILTAESSIGNIKRFGPNGEYKGLIGKAKIGGGCKHVALAIDAKRDYYYMMYEDESSICVLVPRSEAPEFTEDELLAQAAMKGLGSKLVGKWRNADAAEDEVEDIREDRLRKMYLADEIGFADEGFIKQKVEFFRDDVPQPEFTWAPVSQTNDILIISLIRDGVEFDKIELRFTSDDEFILSLPDLLGKGEIRYTRVN